MASLGMNWYLSWWLRIAFLIVSMGVSSNQVHSILPPFIAIIVCINFHTTWLSSVMCLSYQPWRGIGQCFSLSGMHRISCRDGERSVHSTPRCGEGSKALASSRCHCTCWPSTTPWIVLIQNHLWFLCTHVPKRINWV